MARYGKVIFSIECAVDLDDDDMIADAKDRIIESAWEALRHGEEPKVVEAADATEADIPDYLIELRGERRRSPSETLAVPADVAAKLQKAIDGPAKDYRRDDCIFDSEVVFHDGRRMAIQVVTTLDRSGAWTQGVLFSPGGGELGCTEPGDNFEGVYRVYVEDEDGTHTYTVIVEAAKGAAATA